MEIKVVDITIKDGRRAVDNARVKSLAESIGEIGLINPITVTRDNVLVAGLHRLTAVKELGWESIAVTVMDNENSLYLELAEIDENLIRNELHWVEQDDKMKRRKEIYELLHPETRKGAVNQHTKVLTEIISDSKTFTEDTAAKTGKTARTIRSSVQRGAKIAPEIKEDLRKLDVSKTEGTKLARLDKDEQLKVIEHKKEKPDVSIDKAIAIVKRDTKKQQARERNEAIQQNNAALKEDKKYRVIYADPPWKYNDQCVTGGVQGGGVEINHYPTMSIQEICDMPIKNITEKDAVLFLR